MLSGRCACHPGVQQHTPTGHCKSSPFLVFMKSRALHSRHPTQVSGRCRRCLVGSSSWKKRIAGSEGGNPGRVGGSEVCTPAFLGIHFKGSTYCIIWGAVACPTPTALPRGRAPASAAPRRGGRRAEGTVGLHPPRAPH